MIDILVPVLARPQNVRPLLKSIDDTTTIEHEVLFICSEGDIEEITEVEASGARYLVVPFTQRSQYPRKMNHGYQMTNREFIFLGADDIAFEHGWDTKAMVMVHETGAHVIGTNDCVHPLVKQGRFSTHPLIRRSYVDEQGASADGAGSLIHGGYDHNFTDREICHLAQSRGAWAFAHDSIVRHRHPTWRTAPDDDTYRKPRSTAREDQRLFFERSALWEYGGLSAQEASNARRFRFSRERRSRRT